MVDVDGVCEVEVVVDCDKFLVVLGDWVGWVDGV